MRKAFVRLLTNEIADFVGLPRIPNDRFSGKIIHFHKPRSELR
jgi:hypothetical protein